jgi:hypothetical protein
LRSKQTNPASGAHSSMAEGGTQRDATRLPLRSADAGSSLLMPPPAP